jgi:Tfp pilus assembly protein PilF
VTDKDKYSDHLAKANSFADLGKTSSAIKEYQAAYDIIEDSAIPERIKRLREQSLGL